MENNNNKSGLPIAIIGIVLLVAVVGGWWFYNNSQKTTTNRAAATNAANSGKNWNDIFAKAPLGSTPAWSKGLPNAPVVIEEFADFQCPTCASMHPKVQELLAAYGSRIKVIFRQFPLQGHQWSYDAACATEAAGMQGKFWDMQNMIFTNQQNWASSNDARKIFTDYARTLGLDVTKFSDDMIGMVAKNRVDADLQRGRAVNVASTPSFYINNQPLGNNLNALRQIVDAELQKVGK